MRNKFAETIFNQKYAHQGATTWSELASTVMSDVCGDFADKFGKEDYRALQKAIDEMKFIPGGRYLYYAGRKNKYFSNCYLLKGEEDNRQDWAAIADKSTSCLTTGGGIGIDYSIYRPEGSVLRGTGGIASGPLSLMNMVNEIGRNVMQGGSRRSAIYASLNWKHGDVNKFLHAKDWKSIMVGNTGLSVWDLKQQDFNYAAPLDMTNISVNYDTSWLMNYWNTGDLGTVFMDNVRQALMTGEPGFSFNFFGKEKETLRNAPLSGDTRVLTEDGYKTISDIVDAETVLWTGKQWAAATFLKTAEHVPTVKIAMTGGRQITAEPSHEFFVERYVGAGEKRKLVSIEKVPAEDLCPGDILHVALPSEIYSTEDDEDNKWAYLYGFMYGDGTFNRYNGGDITLCTDEKKACLTRMSASDWISSINQNDGRGYTRLYIKSRAFNETDKQHVPHIPDALLPEFLAGLFDSDGNYYADQNRVRLSSIHRNFLCEVRELLETIGIQSTINVGSECRWSGTPSWMLVISANSVSRFSEVIPTERLKVKKHIPYRQTLVKVLSVEDDKYQDVYCCDVGVEEHSFVAEGIVVSNCTEVTSEDDSDVCNLGSVNLSRITSIAEFAEIVELATKFLLCGTLKADLPYAKVYKVREKNRRLGLGLMGLHEWLVQRGYKYEVTEELHRWLAIYRDVSDHVSRNFSSVLGISIPVANRAVAPTGTIGILASTSTGIEPIFSVAYKRRYLKGKTWHYQYVVDGSAKDLVERYNVDPDSIDSALDLAGDPERRIKFQADVQDYVDMSISSTINLPAWGTKLNNEDHVTSFASTLAKYAHRLRGFTCYPDGSRGGQPLTPVSYDEALKQLGEEFEEKVKMHDVCEITGHGGSCGV